MQKSLTVLLGIILTVAAAQIKTCHISEGYSIKPLTMDSPKPTIQHCKFAFDVLIAKLKKLPLPAYPMKDGESKVPIFVTWKREKVLSGCIGTFAVGKLNKVLSQFSLISGTEDDRFPEITLKDLPILNVVVSFLRQFEAGKKAYDFEIGKHGVILQVEIDGKQHQSTYLPEVPVLNNWSKDDTLRHLIKKAGLKLTLEEAAGKIELITYETSRCTLDFKDIPK